MKRICRIASCGNEAEAGRAVCAIHAVQMDRERERKADGRPAASRRGYGADWKRLRDAYFRDHPLCEARMEGQDFDSSTSTMTCGRPGHCVDHIVPVEVAPERRLDPTNLQTLCRGCHRRKTAGEKKEGRTRKRSDRTNKIDRIERGNGTAVAWLDKFG